MSRRPLKYVLLHALAPPLISGLLHLYRFLFRIEFRGLDRVLTVAREGKPIVFAFWHEDFLIAAWGSVEVAKQKIDRAAVLASRSNDGELLARTVKRLGLSAVRGSSSRGARSGLKEMEQHLRTGAQVAIAVDGPRGPRRCAKVGAALVAKDTGALIFPASMHYTRAWRLRSWDRTALPKPFSRCVIWLHEPIAVSATASREELERVRSEIERVLLTETSP